MSLVKTHNCFWLGSWFLGLKQWSYLKAQEGEKKRKRERQETLTFWSTPCVSLFGVEWFASADLTVYMTDTLSWRTPGCVPTSEQARTGKTPANHSLSDPALTPQACLSLNSFKTTFPPIVLWSGKMVWPSFIISFYHYNFYLLILEFFSLFSLSNIIKIMADTKNVIIFS